MNNGDTPTYGLSAQEAWRRREKYGPNRLAKPYEVRFFAILKEEITEPMILLLLAVGVVYSVWGKLEDALTIFSIIIVLVLVEVGNEFRAKKAIDSLSKIAAPKTKVIRESAVTEIDTEQVVPGDILVLSPGARVAGDARLLAAYSLQADESSLTGESLPAAKNAGDEIFAGTLVASGEGKAEVTATGASSRLGKISSLAQTIGQPKTPLQVAMKKLALKLVWIALFFSAAIPVLGLIRGQNLKDMVLTGLALAFATIPEEGPIIITMILGLGAYKLSRNNFLIKKVKAAEVLGNATVILTDKTGTLTENDMAVVSVYPSGNEKDVLAAASSVLTEMSLSATDKAILNRARELGVLPPKGKIVRERGFGDGRKTKTVLRVEDGKLKLYIVGGPEEIFEHSVGDLSEFQRELAKETGLGRRVIAVAAKSIPLVDQDEDFAVLERVVGIAGLLSIEDPPRKGVKETLDLARTAGIRTIMVTGDHAQTALSIARQVGISGEKVLSGAELDGLSDQDLKEAVRKVSVFARSTPGHKYLLLRALQSAGDVVAVTGDGVNDTLALKGADIGIAMGIKGTDAAKEAADVVLADDNYNTIARAVFEGRKFFDNLRKGFGYYLSAKTALILAFALPVIAGLPFPFAPVQIILLELFMDLAASAGFVAEPAERTIYERSPRHLGAKFLDAGMVKNIGLSGVSLFLAVIIPFGYALRQGWPLIEAQTVAFSAWMVGHILMAFVWRSENEPLSSLGVFSNRVINLWAMCAFGFLLLATRIPGLALPLKLQPLSIGRLGLVILVSILAMSWKEIAKLRRFASRRPQ